MTDRSEIIGVRLTPEEREEFEEFVREENEFDSLSRFFGVVAYRYVNADEAEAAANQQSWCRFSFNRL